MRDWTGSRVQADALTIVCPDCHAPIDARCVNTITGQPLLRFPAHVRRISRANIHQKENTSSE